MSWTSSTTKTARSFTASSSSSSSNSSPSPINNCSSIPRNHRSKSYKRKSHPYKRALRSEESAVRTYCGCTRGSCAAAAAAASLTRWPPVLPSIISIQVFNTPRCIGRATTASDPQRASCVSEILIRSTRSYMHVRLLLCPFTPTYSTVIVGPDVSCHCSDMYGCRITRSIRLALYLVDARVKKNSTRGPMQSWRTRKDVSCARRVGNSTSASYTLGRRRLPQEIRSNMPPRGSVEASGEMILSAATYY
uniref:Uncharacterized protein n=1 Tax=Trichogramma kaykai TaxID=54128 RepID=A0ABD2WQH7_9HYME